MIPKTDVELYIMGWSSLDDYREKLLVIMSNLEPDADNTYIEMEIRRVEQIMERVG